MQYVEQLRDSMTDVADAKENNRAAGGGLWTNYVRATMYNSEYGGSTDLFDVHHKEVMAACEAIRALSKDEKNSVASAKSIIKRCVRDGVDVWKRDALGSHLLDATCEPIPRGKSDLQEAKTDFDRIVAMLDKVTKTYEADERDPFNKEQLDTIASKLLVLAENVTAESVKTKAE